jgi:hypothetical protein
MDQCGAGCCGNRRSDRASAADAALGDASATGGEPIRIGTWNLHNFSIYGDAEWRIDAIAGEIDRLETYSDHFPVVVTFTR